MFLSVLEDGQESCPAFLVFLAETRRFYGYFLFDTPLPRNRPYGLNMEGYMRIFSRLGVRERRRGENGKVNDYAAGAFEALSWIRMLIKRSNERCQTCQRVLVWLWTSGDASRYLGRSFSLLFSDLLRFF